jgi:uncharacterized phage protein (TIGR01671 family)
MDVKGNVQGGGKRMKEIKFRGKRIDNGEWAYGFYGNGLVNVIDNKETYRHFIMVWDINGYFTDYEIDPKTVGQYTGMFDNKGDEVYEGDILGTSNTNETYDVWDIPDFGYTVVEWDQKYTCYQGSKWMWDTDNSQSVYDMKFVEVIGNIYENAELLESEGK